VAILDNNDAAADPITHDLFNGRGHGRAGLAGSNDENTSIPRHWDPVLPGYQCFTVEPQVGMDSPAGVNGRNTGEEDVNSVTFESGFHRTIPNFRFQISKG
jgi:hypothetical protein